MRSDINVALWIVVGMMFTGLWNVDAFPIKTSLIMILRVISVEWIWVAIIAALIFFSTWRMKVEYRRGYRDGATKVLGEWKQYMNTEDDIND